MHGDFSRFEPSRDPNYAGVLQQQGRVLLDRDWNDQTRITTGWQDTAARDAIGADVAAIPSSEPWAFRVDEAWVEDGQVWVNIRPGRAWADGLQVNLARTGDDTAEEPTPIKLAATYLDASVQATPGSVDSIAGAVRDVVVLEVWREAYSGFQPESDELREPALGGPDTTERALTAFRFRLARLPGLAASEGCHTVSLADLPRGTLRATLRPSTVLGGECPIPDEGGYTGFEHQLYRVEIARVDAAEAWLKYSRFNGGLVARGQVYLTGATPHFTLAANDLPVRTAGQTAFYLEVVDFDEDAGAWRAGYGAEVQLDGDDLNVVTPRLTLATPTDSPGGPDDPGVFFRLWDGIRRLSDFPSAPPDPPGPTELDHGIRLEFPDASTAYRPGDFWTFSVRAGGLHNDAVLVDSRAPDGIEYHRVPVALLEWVDAASTITLEAGTVHDCRHIFRPLAGRGGCCTFQVGDGIHTHGDFDDLEEAVHQLPSTGGRICLLPGTHHANVRIVGREDVEIAGCGVHTLVVPDDDGADLPLFLVAASRRVSIHDLTLVTATGTAVRVDDADPEALALEDAGPSAAITVARNRIVAGVSAVEARPRNDEGGDNAIVVSENLIGLLDIESGRAAILVSADGVLIERNRVVVVPPQNPDDPADPRGPEAPEDPTFDPCADEYAIYAAGFPAGEYVSSVLVYVVSVGDAPAVAYHALGGIQVAGGSERVRILENEIVGGRGHGITLAELRRAGAGDAVSLPEFWITDLTPDQQAALQGFASTVYDVEIDRNVIRDMGMCGIGVAAFFSPGLTDATGQTAGGFIVRAEGLVVSRNRIERCVRSPDSIPASLRQHAALGGIALADCAHAAFLANRVEGNGADTLEPVCGIFLLAGDRVAFEGNTVVRNGPVSLDSAAQLVAGKRAGIMVSFAMARAIQAILAPDEPPVRDGLPAVRVTGNIVSQPIGQALMIGAIGPVAVTDNSLTALDVDYHASSMTILGATVLILDLAIGKDLLFTIVFLSGLGTLNRIGSRTTFGPTEAAAAAREKLALFPSGGVLFADNQVTLDLRAQEIGGTFSSVTIATLDDLAFTSNQCEVTALLDWIVTDSFLVGATLRAADNRWQEGITFAFYSLFAWAAMNTVTMNQSTNCLRVGALAHRKLELGNQVWLGTQLSSLGYLSCGEGRQTVAQGFAVAQELA